MFCKNLFVVGYANILITKIKIYLSEYIFVLNK